jgi:hypothetical protein
VTSDRNLPRATTMAPGPTNMDENGRHRFALIPIELVREHEEIVDDDVHKLVRLLARTGVVKEPLLVDADSKVVLNGHHRLSALRRLGARLVPAWLVAYDDPQIELDLWRPGPPIPKAEVIARAMAGRPFPPKTTRHRLRLSFPPRPTPLAELGVPVAKRAERRGETELTG